MTDQDVLVVGGGISGASFAYHAARTGRRVRVLERESRVGGCMTSMAAPSGFWYQLGAHTCYNSYGAFLDVIEGCGLLPELQARGKPVLRFLRGEQVVGGKNLFLLMRLFGKFELLRALPKWFGAKRVNQQGETVRSYYSRFVGTKNYDRVLGAMLSAVPSQEAHDFPADMLFKKRERRQDVMRSFTLPGGLRTSVEKIVDRAGIETSTGAEATGIRRDGDAYVVELADGAQHRAAVLALATPPHMAANLLREVAPDAAAAAGRIEQAEVDSMGFVVRKDVVEHVPYATFLIPLNDTFHSVVTRDVVPDAEWRAFTFHFRPGQTRDERIRRAAEILEIRVEDFQSVEERHAVLPSPRLGHADIVTEIDGALAGQPLAVTGNWFGGLSIEDCALRSRAEWQRVAAQG